MNAITSGKISARYETCENIATVYEVGKFSNIFTKGFKWKWFLKNLFEMQIILKVRYQH